MKYKLAIKKRCCFCKLITRNRKIILICKNKKHKKSQ